MALLRSKHFTSFATRKVEMLMQYYVVSLPRPLL